MKILYVTTLSNTINAFLIPHIKLLVELGHEVEIACNIVQNVHGQLGDIGCEIHDIEFQRTPIDKRNLYAYKKLKELIKTRKYDVVHTHTPVASAIVRLACRNFNNIRVIYTAHGFHFHNNAPLRFWLTYYPVERYLAKYTDTIITINNEDFVRAKNNFNVNKVIYMPGVGLSVKKFSNATIDNAQKRAEIGIPKKAFLILSVGELNKNKNHELIIRSISRLNNRNDTYYVICGEGPLKKKLIMLSQSLGLEHQVKLLGYRDDVAEIYKTADVFAFPSYREGLPVSLMEAMASGLPIVCSDVRGNIDLIDHGQGGFLIEPNDIEGFKDALTILRDSPVFYKKNFGEYNLRKITEFDIENVMKALMDIY